MTAKARPMTPSRGALAAALCVVVPCLAAGAPAQSCAPPVPLHFEITGKIVRSEPGFTQGLEFRDGRLYESTGRIGGTTRLNVISLDGRITRLADHGTAVFGEGLTILNDEIVQLTWQEHQVFVYDLDGKLKRKMRNPRFGWGLANDGAQLVFSDGEGSIYFADPKTFAIGKTVAIRSTGAGNIMGLNELEYVSGKLYGNLFTTRLIVRLDPSSGCIDAVADLGSLWNAMVPEDRAQTQSPENVLNGIAHDATSGLFYLTGKLWRSIFVGRFSEGSR
jgi:glutaminyl-peptide cyclotransferase